MNYRKVNWEEVGKRIAAGRKARHLSEEDLGKLLSFSKKYITDIENGRRGMRVETLYKISQILGLSVDYLFDGDGADLPVDNKKKRLRENIFALLSVCSLRQLYRIEQITRLFVEGMVDDE